jgi:poly(A) polymerase
MIKLWARKRGIYGNIYGYLGGISWSILAAQTCVSFPHSEINRLFSMFFYLFDIWKWPKPVILTSIEIPDYDYLKLGVNVWNPSINRDDLNHLMPIITPCFPQFNTSVSVTSNSLKIIKKEIHRAYSLIKVKDQDFEDKIRELYQPYTVVEDYGMFLKLELLADDTLNLHKWIGVVQNRLRILLLSLEKVESLAFRMVPCLAETKNRDKAIIIGIKHSKTKVKTEETKSTQKSNLTKTAIRKKLNDLPENSIPEEDAIKTDKKLDNQEFDKKMNLKFYSETLDITSEISNFIECIRDHRHLAKDANIKINIVKDLSDVDW